MKVAFTKEQEAVLVEKGFSVFGSSAELFFGRNLPENFKNSSHILFIKLKDNLFIADLIRSPGDKTSEWQANESSLKYRWIRSWSK